MTNKRQRILLVGSLALSVAVGFTLLATILRNNLHGYITPSDLLNRDAEVGQNFSVGGLVLPGSLKAIADPLGSEFIIGDGETELFVIRPGNLPDLFQEGELTEVQGTLLSIDPLVLEATKVLAKHDQYYVPANAKAAVDEIRVGLDSQ